MKKRIIKNKKLFRLIISILISFILGILYVAILSKSNKVMIKDNLELYFSSLNKLNYIKALTNSLSTNLLYTIGIWLLGISIIGVPIIILLLLFKSFIIGFTISSIIYFYKFKGILIAIIYIIPLVIDLYLIFFLSYYSLIFSNNLNRLLFLKKEINFKNIMRRYIKILIFVVIGIIISSIIEVYLIPNILKLIKI